MVVTTALKKSDITSSEATQAATLLQIQELQTKEKALYAKLESLSAAGAPVSEQEQTVNKINELSQMRIGLFQQLTEMYDQMQTNVANTRVDLVDQMTVVGVVEQQLNSAKTTLNTIKGTQQGKMRMVEINTYYGKQYLAHTGVMKLIIMVCIPLLILAILRKKDIIPSNIAGILITIVMVVGGFFIIRRLIDLAQRDNMNYDEFNFFFDAASQDPTVWEYDKEQLEDLDFVQDIEDDAQYVADSMGLGCIGENCCGDGMTYDSETEKCVIGTDKEAFENSQGMQTAFIAANDKDKVCPWGKSSTLVKPFNVQANFASV